MNEKPVKSGVYLYRETADTIKASVVVVDENNAHYAHDGFYFGPLDLGVTVVSQEIVPVTPHMEMRSRKIK